MRKRVITALVLAAALTGGLFAQEEYERFGGKKNFISADLGLIVAGLRYERFLNPMFSIGADFYWSNSFFIFNEMEAGIFGRWYPVGGLYLELGLGYHAHSGVEEMEYDYSSPGLDQQGNLTTVTRTITGDGLVVNGGFAISPGVGYKFDPGRPGGFFVEPQINVPITIGEKSFWWGDDKKFGVSIGVVFFAGMGWSF